MVAVVGWWDVVFCRSALSIVSKRWRSVMESMKEQNRFSKMAAEKLSNVAV